LQGQMDMRKMLRAIEGNGTKTVSFHLDRYVGLNMLDYRDAKIGQHPFWSSQFVFTADGGNQEYFKQRGVNHFWLPPAVVEYACVPGTPRDEMKIDVLFTGAYTYHPEYPFRQKLIDWLRETYGNQFRRYGHDSDFKTVRQQDLNDLYASAKVCVGDSCFAGATNYWSDRVPETIGRGGFLIHPETPGLEIPGLSTFQPGNLEQLKMKIDYFLANDGDRRERMRLASAAVRMFHTYTNRVEYMLDVIGLTKHE
jgi:hypothetical protein